MKALKKLCNTPGQYEESVLGELAKDDGANMYFTCSVYEREEGEPAFKQDRLCVIDALERHLIDRFEKVLAG